MVYNDAAYGAEVHHFGPTGTPVDLVHFPDVDVAALARAAGAEGLTVRATADLQPLARWLEHRSGPLLIDAKVNPTSRANGSSVQYLIKDGMSSSPLAAPDRALDRLPPHEHDLTRAATTHGVCGSRSPFARRAADTARRQPLRRPRPAWASGSARDQRARRHPLRRADQLDLRARQTTSPPSRRRLIGPTYDRQVRRGPRRGPGLPAARSDDVRAFESVHGRATQGGFGCLLRTGWDAARTTRSVFLDAGPDGPPTPVSTPSARAGSRRTRRSSASASNRRCRRGRRGGFDPPFPVHNHMLGAGKYGITQLANLARLPPTGATLIVAPLKLVGGTGSPARVARWCSGNH